MPVAHFNRTHKQYWEETGKIKKNIPAPDIFFIFWICEWLEGKFIAFHKEEEMPGPAERV